jgi:hypothetical protein
VEEVEADKGKMLLLLLLVLVTDDDVKNWPPGGPEVEDPGVGTELPGPPGVDD